MSRAAAYLCRQIARRISRSFQLSHRWPTGRRNPPLLSLPAERELTAFFRHRFHFVGKFLFVFEQRCACIAIPFAFVWIPKLTHARLLFPEWRAYFL